MNSRTRVLSSTVVLCARAFSPGAILLAVAGSIARAAPQDAAGPVAGPVGQVAPGGPVGPVGPGGQDAEATASAEAPPQFPPWAGEGEERGLRSSDDRALQGYTLIVPLNSHELHLVDMLGEVAHTWKLDQAPGSATYFAEDGHLLHCTRVPDNPRFHGGGIGGRIVELDWDGNVVWEYVLAGAELTQHHDCTRLPNGHVVLIAWEHHSREEAIARGRDPESVGEEGLWPDVLLEIAPTPPAGGEIVWRWSAWDHLVQDRDPAKPGHGRLADYPGRIDVNAGELPEPPETEEERAKREAEEQAMRGLGYVGGEEDEEDEPPPAPAGPAPGARKSEADWLHTNAVAYHAALDLLVVSTPHLDEVWVIDHSTTTAEAAGSAGGRRGRGGEILYRWGNPRIWGAGTPADQRLFGQHNPTWLGSGAPGDALRLLVFNNGGRRPDDEWSSVDEIVLPFDAARGFAREPGQAFGPPAPSWSYADKGRFLSPFISGAARLANGNTLICEGARGRVFEVTPDGGVAWDFMNPLGGEVEPSPQGGRAPAKALFRAQRIPLDHPGLAGRLGG